MLIYEYKLTLKKIIKKKDRNTNLECRIFSNYAYRNVA